MLSIIPIISKETNQNNRWKMTKTFLASVVRLDSISSSQNIYMNTTYDLLLNLNES